MRRLGAAAAALTALLLVGAAADDPIERLHDPAQEAHARTLFAQVRCLVCQNESIDDSEADLAADLRRIVREQVAAGRTDVEIKRYLADRYGEFVLLKPSLSPANALLWGAPFAILGGGVALIWLRRRKPTFEAPLSPDEQARLMRLSPGSAADTPYENPRPLA